MPPKLDSQRKYERLADFVVALIGKGTLRAGMRAPSLRELAQQHSASLSTAMAAYRLLEDRGVLEARPRSGYYVSSRPKVRMDTPGLSRPPRGASRVAVAQGVLGLLEHVANPELTPLGCAVPSAKVLAARRLDRCMARAARQHGARYNTYTALRGDAPLREQIARRAARTGQLLDSNDIVITCGCTEALSLALGALARRGGTVAIESPTYFGLLQVLQAKGLKVLELPTDATTGVSLAALANALARRRIDACLFASSFNNPLGFAMSEAHKRAILELLARHRVALIEDDIYGDLHHGPQRPRPFAALDPNADIIYCSSFSKTVAPGYRVGWLTTPRHVPRILEAKASATLCGPALPQVAVAEFLASGGYDAHLRRLRRVLADNTHRMLRAVDRFFPPGTRATQPLGGFVLWLELAAGIDGQCLFERALREGICIAPGHLFSATDRYGHCIRLSCGHEWDARIEGSLQTLGRLVAESGGTQASRSRRAAA